MSPPQNVQKTYIVCASNSILSVKVPNARSQFPQSWFDLWDLANRTGGLFQTAKHGGKLPGEVMENVYAGKASYLHFCESKLCFEYLKTY